MKHFIPSLFIEADPPDITVSTDDGTYIGRYDRNKLDPEHEAEGQAIWNIRFVATPNATTTKTLYPNGSQLSTFVWDERESYSYKYAL